MTPQTTKVFFCYPLLPTQLTVNISSLDDTSSHTANTLSVSSLFQLFPSTSLNDTRGGQQWPAVDENLCDFSTTVDDSLEAQVAMSITEHLAADPDVSSDDSNASDSDDMYALFDFDFPIEPILGPSFDLSSAGKSCAFSS